MDSNVIVAAIAVAGTTFATYMTYRASRAATAVGAENTAIQRAIAAEKKADAAEAKADEAEQRADGYIQRLRQVEIKLVRLESRMRYFVAIVHDPYVTLDMIRERIPQDFVNTKDSEGK